MSHKHPENEIELTRWTLVNMIAVMEWDALPQAKARRVARAAFFFRGPSGAVHLLLRGSAPKILKMIEISAGEGPKTSESQFLRNALE